MYKDDLYYENVSDSRFELAINYFMKTIARESIFSAIKDNRPLDKTELRKMAAYSQNFRVNFYVRDFGALLNNCFQYMYENIEDVLGVTREFFKAWFNNYRYQLSAEFERIFGLGVVNLTIDDN